jgi:predicted O-linked N-acetylglucosamine transferase (SPINDLY family)
MLKRGFVTFGSFNSPQKINDRVLKTWSDLLHALPDARLKLKYMNKFQSEFLCNRILAKLDVAPDRVSFYRGPQTSMTEHFLHYHDIDVALDTFPFPGATTTFEALWMGVPVLALPGDTMMSRWSLEDLMAVGLNQFVANSPEDFVQRGVEWAANPTGLTAIRSTVRERLRNSPLCDGAARARQFERVFQAVWRRWLADRQPGQ